MFSRFDTVPAYDRRTNGQTDVQPISITCFSIADARKNGVWGLLCNLSKGLQSICYVTDGLPLTDLRCCERQRREQMQLSETAVIGLRIQTKVLEQHGSRRMAAALKSCYIRTHIHTDVHTEPRAARSRLDRLLAAATG